MVNLLDYYKKCLQVLKYTTFAQLVSTLASCALIYCLTASDFKTLLLLNKLPASSQVKTPHMLLTEQNDYPHMLVHTKLLCSLFHITSELNTTETSCDLLELEN